MDKRQFAEWMTHLGVCVGRPVDRALLASYWLELSGTVTEEELAEAVKLLLHSWTEERFPKVAHIRQAVARTRWRRARDAAKRVRQLDLQGFDLANPKVRGYVAWRISDDLHDSEVGRAVLSCDLSALRQGQEQDAIQLVRRALDVKYLPALPTRDGTDPQARLLVAGIGDFPT